MKAKDIIKQLEEFDPEAELAIRLREVSLAGHVYDHFSHMPEFVEMSDAIYANTPHKTTDDDEFPEG